jgi:hypothetical protein
MTWWRPPGAGEILWVYFLLAVVAAILVAHFGEHADASQQERLLPFQAFLAWRVSRGGWLSRVLLICISFVFYLACALSPEAAVNDSTAQVEIFLAQAYASIPAGAELPATTLDAELNAIFGKAA